MKILKLRALNINSLKGKTEIDFTKFIDNNSIFVITGATGAGKSTILDIICCALYGQTPRRFRNLDDLISKGTSEGYCEVEFEINGTQYISSWSRRRARNKVDGKLQSSQMTISHLNTKEPLYSGIKDVQNFIEEISGLDFGKFTKSMMLAQGGFDAFLKATETDRSQLLEKITGTAIYSDISKKVFEKHKEIKLDLKSKKDIVDNFEILSEDILNLKNQEKDINYKRKLEIDMEIKEVANKVEEEIKMNSIRENVINLKRTILSKEEDIKTLEAEYNDSIISIKNISNNIDIEENYLKKNITDKSLIEDINLIAENIKNYEEQYILKESIADEFEKSKDTYINFVDKKEILLEDIDSLEYKFNNIDLIYQKSIKDAKDDILKEPSLRDTKLKLELLLKNRDRLKELKDDIKSAKKIKKGLSKSIKKKKSAVQELIDDIKVHRDNKEKDLLIQNYEEVRKKLKDGEACLLCGSTKHPYIKDKNSIPQDDITSKLLKKETSLLKKETSLKELETKLAIVNEELDRNSLERDNIKIDIKTSDIKGKQKKIESNLKDISKNLSKIIERRDSRENLLKSRDELNKMVQDKKGELSSIENMLAKLEESILILEDKKDKNSDEIEKLYKSLTSKWKEFNLIFDTSSYSVQYQELVERKDNFFKVEKSLDNLKKDKQNIKLKESEVSAKLDTIKKEIVELNKNLNDIKVEDSSINIDDLKDIYNTKREESDRLQKLIGKIEEQLEKDRESKIKYQEKVDELEKDKKNFEICEKIDNLIGSANGAKFAKFAQGITLDQLIELANIYLNRLTKRYTLVRPQADNKRELLEIYITDKFQADVIRPVSTLSGGESFIVSLSLALGLSELASQKISIESLFLDEGFGTLDDENLEMAINALNNLQSSGKMVGVISHIEALKERIPTQIRVIANGDGTSRIDLEL